MAITAQRLLTELGNRAWSGFNADDMIWGNEDARQAVAELNAAILYLINLEDFPFRKKEMNITARENNPTYSVPVGQITNLYNTDTRESLVFYRDSSAFDKTLKGEPIGYWIEYNNPNMKMRLYPIPDGVYNLKAVFNQYKPVLKADTTTDFEFSAANDSLNMPDDLQLLFMNCIVLRTMVTNNKDEQDENYRPMISEFNEYWKLFKQACKPARATRYVKIWE